MILGLILKLVLVWLVFRAVIKLARGIMAGLGGAPPTPPAVALVRDPVCGTFVAPANAPSLGTGSQMRFFCSDNCRRIYQAKSGR
jgi:YHS domain-containing protein